MCTCLYDVPRARNSSHLHPHPDLSFCHCPAPPFHFHLTGVHYGFLPIRRYILTVLRHMLREQHFQFRLLTIDSDVFLSTAFGGL